MFSDRALLTSNGVQREIRGARCLAVAALLSVGCALTVRWWHRGYYYPGWDIMGAAQGLYLVSTKSTAEILRFYWEQPLYGVQAWNVDGLPLSLVPGWLTSRFPWEFWAHVNTMAMVALSLWFLGRALRLAPRQWWFLLLCWGASPALLSYTVTGFPYISNTLPYALALWVVFRWQTSVVATLLLSFFTLALAWHVQELGRTVFLVFGAAALLLPSATWHMRAAWLAAGALQYGIVSSHQTFNTARYAAMGLPPIAAMPAQLRDLARYLFIEHGPDLPVLLVGGLLAIFATGRERRFWGALLGAHLGLLLLLISNTGPLQGLLAVWPRRVLLLQFLCAATIVTALRCGGRLRPVLLGLLLLGNTWQLIDTLRWASRDTTAQASFFALPFTQSPVPNGSNLDSRVHPFVVDWYRSLRREIEAGRKLLLVYNLSSFDENATDPAGVIDRLYLDLGHDRFMDTVWVFGNQSVRWNELPIRPLEQFASFVQALDPGAFVGEWLYHRADDRSWENAQVHRAEVKQMFDVLNANFDLEWSGPDRDAEGRERWRFKLRRKSAGGAERLSAFVPAVQ